MLYIYRPSPSESARDLVRTLRSLSLRARRLRRDWSLVRPESPVVCWGISFSGERTKILNARAGDYNKLQELSTLRSVGVPVPDFCDTFPKSIGWFGRKFRHHSASDIGCTYPDFWTKEVDTRHELRIHIFLGKSIRAGIKVPTEGAHPKVRSRSLGWRLSYGSDCQRVITEAHREAARKAVAALSLDFGAVDVGVYSNGKPVVFEVNTSPSLRDSNTALAYAKYIKLWAEGDSNVV